jgi:hypothetical protein
MLMLLFSMLGWWYTRGWAWLARHMLLTRNKRIAEFFSVADLLKTMFAPFRQDSIDTKNAPISLKLQALGGNLISRIFGFIIRLILIISGLVLIVVNTVIGLELLIVWPLLPFAPLVTFLLIMIGVGFVNV